MQQAYCPSSQGSFKSNDNYRQFRALSGNRCNPEVIGKPQLVKTFERSMVHGKTNNITSCLSSPKTKLQMAVQLKDDQITELQRVNQQLCKTIQHQRHDYQSKIKQLLNHIRQKNELLDECELEVGNIKCKYQQQKRQLHLGLKQNHPRSSSIPTSRQQQISAPSSKRNRIYAKHYLIRT